MLVLLAFGAGFTYWLHAICLTTACEKLVKRLRVLAFSNILRQPISWMDQDDNSPYKLCTQLARDAPLVKSVCTKLVSFGLIQWGICLEGDTLLLLSENLHKK
jgi:ABC-type multidrug transport system fused ATPase/permease subunit